MLEIYTDGSTRNNGKADSSGGWGYIVVIDNKIDCYDSGTATSTTNQKMELTAAIEACKFICPKPLNNFIPITIYSDSAYLINCYYQNWWRKWEINGWKNSKNEPVANKELWEQLIPYFKNFNIKFSKVKGHSESKDDHSYFNNLVDKLAKTGSF